MLSPLWGWILLWSGVGKVCKHWLVWRCSNWSKLVLAAKRCEQVTPAKGRDLVNIFAQTMEWARNKRSTWSIQTLSSHSEALWKVAPTSDNLHLTPTQVLVTCGSLVDRELERLVHPLGFRTTIGLDWHRLRLSDKLKQDLNYGQAQRVFGMYEIWMSIRPFDVEKQAISYLWLN